MEFEFNGSRRCSGAEISEKNTPSVRVFNRAFVDATVTTVGTGFDPIYYLGEDSAEKRAAVEKLRKSLVKAKARKEKAAQQLEAAESAVDKLCVDRARLIKESLTSSGIKTYSNYDKRRFKRVVGQMDAAAAERARLDDDEKRRWHQRRDTRPRDPVDGVALQLPDFQQLVDDVERVVGTSVVAETLDDLVADPSTAKWVRTGLGLHPDGAESRCRFCGETLTSARRASLEGHFNDALAAFMRDVSLLWKRLDEARTRLAAPRWPDPSHVYDQLGPKLATARDVATQRCSEASAWIEELMGLVASKREAPFAATSLPTELRRAIPDQQAISEAVSAVDAVVQAHNGVVADVGGEIARACEHLEQHFVGEVWEEHARLVSEYDAATETRALLDRAPAQIEEQIAAIERDIIEHRRPADELNAELRSYLGRDELRFDIKDTGYTLSRSGNPVTHLSEGERAGIAFLYFLKGLQDRSFDLKKGVVVVDDPVSSLDANALFSAFGHMKERTREAGQLIILTHNFGFFREVRNWLHHLPKQRSPDVAKRPGRFFQLRAESNAEGVRSATLGRLDPLLEQYESEYHYLFSRVYDEAHNTAATSSLEHHYSMPNVARRLVEAFLAFRYPHLRGDLWTRFAHVEFDDAKKTRILRLLNTYSHSAMLSEPGHDPTALTETRPVLSQLLEMIKAVDPVHYDGLLSLVGAGESS